MSDDDGRPEPEIIAPKARRRRAGSAAPEPEILNAGEAAPKAAASKPKSRRSRADKIAEMAREIQGAHEVMALWFNMPELAIPPEAAQMLAQPTFDVAAKYGMDGGIPVEAQLVFALAMVYGPMLRAINRRQMSEAASQPPPAAAASPAASPVAPGTGPVFDIGAAAAANGHDATRDF